MKARSTKTLAVLLSFVMALVVVSGCQNSSTAQGGNTSKSNASSSTGQSSTSSNSGSTSSNSSKPVPLQVFFSGSLSGQAVKDGVQTDGVAQAIDKKLGVQLNFVGSANTDDQHLNTLLASGDLPDLTYISDPKYFNQIIKGGLAMPLDDLIQKYGKDILANSPEKVAFSKKYDSNGSGKLYVIPAQSGPAQINDVPVFGFNIRWDLYKKLGYPTINSYMDVLPLLKKMQALEPTNPQGQKTYAISLNTDWDGPTALYTTELGPLYGWDTTDQQWHAEVNDMDGYSIRSSFDPNSWMFKGADFLYQANQMGLLDPDSLSQKWDTRNNKMQTGRVLFSYVNWDTGVYDNAQLKAGHPEKGFMPIYPKDSTTMISWGAFPNGQPGGWVISSKAKNPEKAMEFLNYINSYEGAMTIYDGIKGKDWVIKDGKPYMTDEALKAIKDPNNTTGIGKYYNAAGLNSWTINPKYNMTVDNGEWLTTKQRTFSALWKDYDSHYGVDTPYKAYDKQRTKTVISDPYRDYMDPMPDNIASIYQKVSDMTKNEMYKMIFAKNKTEELKWKNDIIQKAKELGEDKEFQWIQQDRVKAKARYEAAQAAGKK